MHDKWQSSQTSDFQARISLIFLSARISSGRDDRSRCTRAAQATLPINASLQAQNRAGQTKAVIARVTPLHRSFTRADLGFTHVAFNVIHFAIELCPPVADGAEPR